MGTASEVERGTPARFLDVLAERRMSTPGYANLVHLAEDVWPGTDWIEELRAAAALVHPSARCQSMVGEF